MAWAVCYYYIQPFRQAFIESFGTPTRISLNSNLWTKPVPKWTIHFAGGQILQLHLLKVASTQGGRKSHRLGIKRFGWPLTPVYILNPPIKFTHNLFLVSGRKLLKLQKCNPNTKYHYSKLLISTGLLVSIWLQDGSTIRTALLAGFTTYRHKGYDSLSFLSLGSQSKAVCSSEKAFEWPLHFPHCICASWLALTCWTILFADSIIRSCYCPFCLKNIQKEQLY